MRKKPKERKRGILHFFLGDQDDGVLERIREKYPEFMRHVSSVGFSLSSRQKWGLGASRDESSSSKSEGVRSVGHRGAGLSSKDREVLKNYNIRQSTVETSIARYQEK